MALAPQATFVLLAATIPTCFRLVSYSWWWVLTPLLLWWSSTTTGDNQARELPLLALTDSNPARWVVARRCTEAQESLVAKTNWTKPTHCHQAPAGVTDRAIAYLF